MFQVREKAVFESQVVMRLIRATQVFGVFWHSKFDEKISK